jgi:hypothetical protein
MPSPSKVMRAGGARESLAATATLLVRSFMAVALLEGVVCVAQTVTLEGNPSLSDKVGLIPADHVR